MKINIIKFVAFIGLCCMNISQVIGQTVAIYKIDVQSIPTTWDVKSVYDSDDPNIYYSVAQTVAGNICSGISSIVKEKMNYSSVQLSRKTLDIDLSKSHIPGSGLTFGGALMSLGYLPFSTFNEAKKEFEGVNNLMKVTILFKSFRSASNLVIMDKVKKPGYICYNVEVIIEIKNSNGELIKEKKYTCTDFSEVLTGTIKNEKQYRVECDGKFTKDIVLKSINYAFAKAMEQ